MKDQRFIEQLAAFDIGTLEAQIYLYLVGKPPVSILEIATALNLPRTSVYDNAGKLVEKGLVERIVQHKSHQLKAYPLEILQTYIDKEKSRIKSLQEKLTTLEQGFSQVSSLPETTEVRYYHGSKGVQQMVWNTLRAKGELISYSQFGLTEVVSDKFIERYNQELVDRKIHNRIITNPVNFKAWLSSTKVTEAYTRSLLQCRTIVPEELRISGDTTIYNNVFAVTNWEHSEVVGIEIENPDIVRVQRSIFDVLWTRSQPTKTG
jgi:sugar-specific transcriptional regulator TrmB